MKLREAGGRLRSAVKYVSDYQRFTRDTSERFPSVRWGEGRAMLADATESTGFDRHYVYHTAWAARVLSTTGDAPHCDFGSLLYFATMVSAFRDIKFFDFRPAEVRLSGLESEHADLTNLQFETDSLPSVSCMHVVEHIGLGRYGDPIDPDGDRKAAAELERVVAPGGDLLFVVPVGKPKIVFNAHRIYSYEIVRSMFPNCELVEFSMAPDPGPGEDFIENCDPALVAEQEYGCGCFWFRKLPSGEAAR